MLMSALSPLSGITNAASETRRRPHCLTWVANFQRFGSTESDAELLLQHFQERFSISGAVQLTRLERTVVLSMAFKTAAGFRDGLLSYLEVVPWNKSPFTNEALACPALVVGWSPKATLNAKSRVWKDRLTTTDTGLGLFLQRWVGWYDGLPEALKRKKGSAEVEEEVTRCNLFASILELWRRDAPPAQWPELEAEVASQFANGFLDEQLDDVIRTLPSSWVYTSLAIVQSFRDKQSQEERKEMELKEAEAANRLTQASLEEWEAHLQGDHARFGVWLAACQQARDQTQRSMRKYQDALRSKGSAAVYGILDKHTIVTERLPTKGKLADRTAAYQAKVAHGQTHFRFEHFKW